MVKLHLAVRPASEGAVRVARWVMTLRGGIAEAAQILDVSEEWIQRIVDGDLLPGLRIGARLASRMEIRAAMFQSAPKSGWFGAVPEALAA